MTNCNREGFGQDDYEDDLSGEEGLGDFEIPPRYTVPKYGSPCFPMMTQTSSLNEQLLQALLKSHADHIETLKVAKRAEVELMMQVWAAAANKKS